MIIEAKRAFGSDLICCYKTLDTTMLMDGWMDGWMDEMENGWVNGSTDDFYINSKSYPK